MKFLKVLRKFMEIQEVKGNFWFLKSPNIDSYETTKYIFIGNVLKYWWVIIGSCRILYPTPTVILRDFLILLL